MIHINPWTIFPLNGLSTFAGNQQKNEYAQGER